MRPIFLNNFDNLAFAEFSGILYDSLREGKYDFTQIRSPEEIDLKIDAGYFFYPSFGMDVNNVNIGNGLDFDLSKILLEKTVDVDRKAKIYMFLSERIFETENHSGISSHQGDLWKRIENLRSLLDGIFVVNRYFHDLLIRHGYPSHFFPVGYSRKFGNWEKTMAPENREIDMLHLGYMTNGDRRQNLLNDAIRSGINVIAGDGCWGDERISLLRNTKVLLNLHYDVPGDFQWERALMAAHNGCILLSEKIVDPYPFEPWKHYIEFVPENFTSVAKELLENYTSISSMVHENMHELISNFNFTDCVTQMLDIVADRETK